jgi:hypothetical protein
MKEPIVAIDASDARDGRLEEAKVAIRERTAFVDAKEIDAIECSQMRAMEVYGEPSDDLLRLLRQEAQMLGGVPVRAHTRHAGFARFDTS